MIEIILIFQIVVAIIALESKNLISSIISLGGVGFGLAIIMLFLRAPDVAIVQILVEVVLLIVLIRATISRDITEVKCRKEFFNRVFGISMLGVLFLAIIFTIGQLPEFGMPVVDTVAGKAPFITYLKEGLRQTGSPNIVTAVLLDYRAYDTLGEATVLFAAIMGIVVILRKN
ncbi:hydrogen gas-evolving membrane-bound hydrogenase subunit E [Elusimicrobiota bacterium]